MKLLIFAMIGLIGSMIYSCSPSKPLIFEKYEAGSTVSSSDSTSYILVYFIHNHTFSEQNEKKIDHFTCALYSNLTDSLKSYYLEYYKISKKTNLTYLASNPDHFFGDSNFLTQEGNAFSNDYLWAYNFYSNGGIRKYKLKNYEALQFFHKDIICSKK